MKKVLLALMVVMMLAGMMAGCAGAAQTEEESESAAVSASASESVAAETSDALTAETFKVGMECAYPPYNWTQMDDSNGAVAIEGTEQYAGGYDVEIAKLIAEGLGRELVIVPTAWDGLVPAVQSGVIDAIIAGMSPLPDRREAIDFSDSYYRSDIVLGIVVKKGGAYEGATSFADFAGAKITGQLGTFHYDVIDQITGVDKQEAMKDFSAMRVALQSGIIDGYVSEKPEGESAMTADPDTYYFVEFPAGAGFTISDDYTTIAVGVKKGEADLLAGINEVLAGLSNDDRIAIMDAAIANQSQG